MSDELRASEPRTAIVPTDEDTRIERSAELVDWASLADVAIWVASAAAGGVIGNATYAFVVDKVRAWGRREGGERTEQLLRAAYSELRDGAEPGLRARLLALFAEGDFDGPPDALPSAWEGATPSRYVFFVAHASPDKPRARRLREALEPHGPAFVDVDSISPGDAWARAIPDALASARVVPVLLSRRSSEAWYQGEEILQAIAQHRAGESVVVPVRLERDVALPYGLKGLQAIDWPAGGPLTGVVVDLLRAWERIGG